MRDTTGEVKSISYVTFSNETLHSDVYVLDDQLHNSVRTQDVV